MDTFGTFNLMETHTELKTSIDTDCSCERLLQVQVSHVSFDMYNNGVKKCEFVFFCSAVAAVEYCSTLVLCYCGNLV